MHTEKHLMLAGAAACFFCICSMTELIIYLFIQELIIICS